MASKRNNKSKKPMNTFIQFGIVFIIMTILLISRPVFAQDDGARAYWNAQENTNIFSFQYLPMKLNASDALTFAPGHELKYNTIIRM